MKAKILASSCLVIVLCLCLIAGSTYALFTSTDEVNIAVTAGTVKVVATAGNEVARSLESPSGTYPINNGTFTNLGTYELNGNVLTIDRMTPGDAVKFDVEVKNESNVAIQYRLIAKSTVQLASGEVDLLDALTIKLTIGNGQTITLTPAQINGANVLTTDDFSIDGQNAGEDIDDLVVEVEFPNGDADDSVDANGDPVYGDNHYQGAKAAIAFVLEAVQGNGNF